LRPDLHWATATRSNLRRLRVFVAALVVALGISLGYTWLRPPEYRAVARLEITPGVRSLPSASSAQSMPGAPEATRPFLTEVQVLVSRPVLEEAAARLQGEGEDLSAFGADAVGAIERHLQASPVADTHVVELNATGPRPALLAPIVNTVIDVYQGRLAKAYQSETGEALAQADDEVARLGATVEAKRRDVEAFRLRNNIVSLERDENEVLARVRNLGNSLSTANDKVAEAEGKVRALSASGASGTGAVQARDDPTLANLEQRASQIREELHDLERGFTPDYMAKDPKVVAERARLAELERQITERRAVGRQNAVLEAQEQLASARGAAARIHEDMVASRGEAAQFTSRFNQYKALQAELDDLEKAQREAVQRRAKLEASERERMPSVRVLEAAAAPEAPWRPLYWRDTAISAGGSLVLALLAMWLVELFNRPEPQPSVVLIQPQGGALRYEGAGLEALTERGNQATRLGGAEPALLDRTEPALLPRQAHFPRELRQEEVSALIAASDERDRVVILLLLSGVTLDEALTLRLSDIDLSQGVLQIGGASAREVSINEALHRALSTAQAAAQEPLVPAADSNLQAMRASVDAQILCAAHDAGIERPAEVNADCLRHTFVSFLVRQGIRFSDLTHVVGNLPVELVGAYSTLSPAGTRLAKSKVELCHPGLHAGSA